MFQTATILANALVGLHGIAPWSADPPDPSPTSEAPAREEDESPYRTVVTPAPMPAQRELDLRTPGFATATELDTVPGARPADALAEVVARTPGASTRSVGGLGQFSAVSLRGSASNQVSLFLDGVPLGSALAGLVNLADMPTDGLGRIEIYRGYVPISFGSAAIGGAINLVSRTAEGPPRLRVGGGLGSLGTRESRVAVTTPIGAGLALGTRVGYAGSEGNFRFLDTAGTPTPADDRTSIRQNNGYDRVLAQVRLDRPRGPTRFAVQEMVVYRRRGEPGTASAQASAASASSLVSRSTASVERPRFGRPGGRLGWVFGVGVSQLRFEDPLGEVGIAANDQTTVTADVYTSPRLRVPLWRGAFLSIVGDARPEFVAVTERRDPGMSFSGDARRRRIAFGIGAELQQFAWEHRILLAPAVRLDALANAFAVGAGEGEPGDEGRDDATFGVSPRLGGRLQVAPWLQLRASAGRYFRPPTLLELFGDRGYFVGNEGLVAERGTAIDGGLVVDHEQDEVRVYAQLAGFSTWSEDLIQWATAGAVSRPENIPGAFVRGVESALEVVPTTRALVASATYTFTDSEDRSDDASRRGQPLPGRPRHDLFARATSGWEWMVRGVEVEPRALYTVEFVAATYLDPSGRFELPPRALQGIGGELHLARRVHLAVEVRNLLDVRTGTVVIPTAAPTPVVTPISDFLGYPLPGRSVFVSLEIEGRLDGRRRRRRARRRGALARADRPPPRPTWRRG